MTYRVEGSCIPIEFLVMGPIDNNVYIIGSGEDLFVVDPTCEADRILAALDGRVPSAIVLTHQHWDHVGAAADLRTATGAPVIAHTLDAPFITGERSLRNQSPLFKTCPVDRTVEHEDMLEIGKIAWRVLHTPGHTPGSMCLFAAAKDSPNPDGASVLVSGDTLFAGATGRTDFENGSPDDMRNVALPRLAELPDETIVLPGHEGLTTIATERRRVFARYDIMR